MERYISILEKWKTEYVRDKNGKSKPKRTKDDKEKLKDDDVDKECDKNK